LPEGRSRGDARIMVRPAGSAFGPGVALPAAGAARGGTEYSQQHSAMGITAICAGPCGPGRACADLESAADLAGVYGARPVFYCASRNRPDISGVVPGFRTGVADRQARLD